MGDVVQILGVNTNPTQTPLQSILTDHPKPKSKSQSSTTRPPKGMSREVFQLLQTNDLSSSSESNQSMPHGFSSSSQSSLPPIFPSSSIQMKRSAANSSLVPGIKPQPGKVSKWSWAPFSSSARTDGALFEHWVKSGVEYPDYPYARFNVHMDPVEYNDEEYNSYLASSEWTRSDTDQLMSLCRRLDLRWAVINDRFAATPKRSIEQLQHRYYCVASRLTHTRLSIQGGGVIDSSNPISNLGTGTSSQTFNLAYEEERRRQMETVWRRSKEEEKEDAYLKKELRLIEVQLRKIKKTGKPLAAVNGVVAPEASTIALFHRPPPTPNAPYLQSQRLANPTGAQGLSKTLLTKMDLILKELGIDGKLLPTKVVCDMYDQLRKSIVTMLALQKIARKKEASLLGKKLEMRRMGGNLKQDGFEVIPEVVNANYGGSGGGGSLGGGGGSSSGGSSKQKRKNSDAGQQQQQQRNGQNDGEKRQKTNR